MTATTIHAAMCRCGRAPEGADDHPCHGDAYTCDRMGTARLVSTSVLNTEGSQWIATAYRTYACDACWADFLRERR